MFAAPVVTRQFRHLNAVKANRPGVTSQLPVQAVRTIARLAESQGTPFRRNRTRHIEEC